MNLILMMALLVPSNVDVTPQRSDFEELVILREGIDIAHKSKLDESVVNSYTKVSIEAAHKIDDSINSYDDLKQATQTLSGTISGVFTFRNIILVTACVFCAVAIMLLCGVYLIGILAAIPLEVYEILCYAASFWGIVAGSQVGASYTMATVIPGCLGLMFCLGFTFERHFAKDKYADPPVTTISFILCVVWGAVALFYDSQIVGFMSITALLSALSFGAGMFPGVVFVGFENDKVVPHGTLSCFIVITTHIVLTITGVTVEWLEPFRPGMEFLGTFGYFLGIIVLASKYYWNEIVGYLLMQPIAILSGIAALYIGSIYGMGTLLGVGGTWFYLYILEKYYEIPWKGTAGWSWSLLGLSGILYSMYAIGVEHPEYFLW